MTDIRSARELAHTTVDNTKVFSLRGGEGLDMLHPFDMPASVPFGTPVFAPFDMPESEPFDMPVPVVVRAWQAQRQT